MARWYRVDVPGTDAYLVVEARDEGSARDRAGELLRPPHSPGEAILDSG